MKTKFGTEDKEMFSRKVAIVTGASSGLGLLIASELRSIDYLVYGWSKDNIDLTSEDDVKARSEDVIAKHNHVDFLINCAGINGIEFIPKLTSSMWDQIIDTNARAIFLTAKYLVDHMRGGTILNIISNASHMPMTSSLAYNASKGAAAIMTKQMSRELIKTHGITVFGISPNKLSGTGMSSYIDNKVCELRGWTPDEARAYQIASLPAGEETDPKTLAEFIGFLLSSKKRHKYLAGCDIPYGL